MIKLALLTDKQPDEHVYFSLRLVDDEIYVVAAGNGVSNTLLKVKPNGTMARNPNLPNYWGFVLDSHGRIALSEEPYLYDAE